MPPTPKGPTQEQQRAWQAEELVRRKLMASPEFKREIQRVSRELKKLETSVKPRKK